MTDYSQMTLDELRLEKEKVDQEVQRRTLDEQLLDMTHLMVMRARNHGYTRGQVLKHVNDVLNAYYQGGGTA